MEVGMNEKRFADPVWINIYCAVINGMVAQRNYDTGYAVHYANQFYERIQPGAAPPPRFDMAPDIPNTPLQSEVA
jgi:hypothetical protein